MGVEFAGMVIPVPDFEIQIYMCWLWNVQVIVDIYPWSLKRRYKNRKLEVAFELNVIFKKEKKNSETVIYSEMTTICLKVKESKRRRMEMRSWTGFNYSLKTQKLDDTLKPILENNKTMFYEF